MALRRSSSKVGKSFSFFSLNSSNSRTWIHCVPNSMARRARRGHPSACAESARPARSGSCKLARGGEPAQLLIGHRRPEEVAEPGRQFPVVDGAGVFARRRSVRCGRGTTATPARASARRGTLPRAARSFLRSVSVQSRAVRSFPSPAAAGDKPGAAKSSSLSSCFGIGGFDVPSRTPRPVCGTVRAGLSK